MEENNKVEMNGMESAEGQENAIEVKEGKGRKILKWVVRGLVLVVTGVVGGLIGHHIGQGDDDEETQETEETNE